MAEHSRTEQATAETFRLSERLAVEITAGAGGLTVEWDPEMPNQLTEEELHSYQGARHEMLMRLSEIVGAPIMVVEAR